MREIDRIAIESGLSLLQMMENAGIRLSEVAWTFLELRPGRRVVVLAGGGNNGGGALAAARHLANRGADVTVVPDRPVPGLSDAGRRQLEILEQAHVPVSFEPPSAPEAIIDGLIGYGLRGDPQGQTSVLIEWANRSGALVCSLDLPSGLDANIGVPSTPCVPGLHHPYPRASKDGPVLTHRQGSHRHSSFGGYLHSRGGLRIARFGTARCFQRFARH